MKIIRVSFLMIALAGSVYAGDIPLGGRTEGEIPIGGRTAGEKPLGVYSSTMHTITKFTAQLFALLSP